VRVARIVIEAPVTSFRYPHFLIGRQLTYDLPPPSTIYGHVSSAAGELMPPEGVEFGYIFTFESRGRDLEYQHIVGHDSRSMGVPRKFRTLTGNTYQTNVGGTIQPQARDFLYGCRLILYLKPWELGKAFRQPVFPVLLGRSQDLAAVTEVSVVDLEPCEAAYLEHTLLPFALRRRTPRGVTVLMPRYITPPPDREPTFAQYVVLHERLFAGTAATGSRDLIRFDRDQEEVWWVDPTSPQDRRVHRAVVFHRFVDPSASE